jgi:hypothetical protein
MAKQHSNVHDLLSLEREWHCDKMSKRMPWDTWEHGYFMLERFGGSQIIVEHSYYFCVRFSFVSPPMIDSIIIVS